MIAKSSTYKPSIDWKKCNSPMKYLMFLIIYGSFNIRPYYRKSACHSFLYFKPFKNEYSLTI